ncbi:hypothetical protein SAMN05216574_1021, partial [Blastococcus tunisiensis]
MAQRPPTRPRRRHAASAGPWRDVLLGLGIALIVLSVATLGIPTTLMVLGVGGLVLAAGIVAVLVAARRPVDHRPVIAQLAFAGLVLAGVGWTTQAAVDDGKRVTPQLASDGDSARPSRADASAPLTSSTSQQPAPAAPVDDAAQPVDQGAPLPAGSDPTQDRLGDQEGVGRSTRSADAATRSADAATGPAAGSPTATAAGQSGGPGPIVGPVPTIADPTPTVLPPVDPTPTVPPADPTPTEPPADPTPTEPP